MVVAAVTFIGLGLGVRALTGHRMVDDTGALAQCSGTALYASMVYAGVVFVRPRLGPVPAGALALGFCWAVEVFQLTGLPAALSARSVAARLALGVEFDPTDLLWYPMGVLPLMAAHWWLGRRAARRSPATDAPAAS
jgi:hypothetical protein